MCEHQPLCPPANGPDSDAARVVAAHPGQGWSLLCNGVVLFDDYGKLLPDGRAVSPPMARRIASAPPRPRQPICVTQPNQSRTVLVLDRTSRLS
jgi:hypothetical protein